MSSAKIKKSHIFDCDDLTNFISSVVNIISYAGYSDSKFFVNQLDGGKKFVTKLSFYTKDGPELYGIVDKTTMNQVDAEIAILKTLQREITDANISPCIINLLHVHYCSSNVAKKRPIDYENCREDKFFYDTASSIYNMFCANKDNVERGVSYDKLAFIALEYGDTTLRAFLQEHAAGIIGGHIVKSLLFQIIFTFYAITEKFPSFKHNDLHADNILLVYDQKYTYEPDQLKYLTYSDGKTEWNLPYFGIIPKIIDFGFSVIEEKNIRSNAILNKTFTSKLLRNDIFVLLYDIYNSVAVDAIDDLIFMLDPTYFYRTFDIEYTNKNNVSYKQMLRNKAWKEYKHNISPAHQYAAFTL